MREEVKRWWGQSKQDLDTAKILYKNKKYDATSLFCQQACEKALKALILKKEGKIEKIHDLVKLGKKANLPDLYNEIFKELNQAYIYCRYPDIKREANIKNIAHKFLQKTKEVLKWIEKKILSKN